MTYEELSIRRKHIEEAKAALNKEESEFLKLEKEFKKEINSHKWKFLFDNKESILSIMNHDRTSCSDENPCNGIYTSGDRVPRCRKCALIEIFRDEYNKDYFEVDINIQLTPIA